MNFFPFVCFIIFFCLQRVFCLSNIFTENIIGLRIGSSAIVSQNGDTLYFVKFAVEKRASFKLDYFFYACSSGSGNHRFGLFSGPDSEEFSHLSTEFSSAEHSLICDGEEHVITLSSATVFPSGYYFVGVWASASIDWIVEDQFSGYIHHAKLNLAYASSGDIPDPGTNNGVDCCVLFLPRFGFVMKDYTPSVSMAGFYLGDNTGTGGGPATYSNEGIYVKKNWGNYFDSAGLERFYPTQFSYRCNTIPGQIRFAIYSSDTGDIFSDLTPVYSSTEFTPICGVDSSFPITTDFLPAEKYYFVALWIGSGDHGFGWEWNTPNFMTFYGEAFNSISNFPLLNESMAQVHFSNAISNWGIEGTLKCPCENCTVLENYNKICTDCLPNFYMNKSANCIPCPGYKNGYNCSQCPDNFNDDCTECLPNYNIDTECTGCLPNFKIDSACTECLPNFNIDTDCTECLPNFNIDTECTECLPNFNIDTDCAECLPNFNIDTDCTECLPNYNIDTECAGCLPNYNIDTECAECLPMYVLTESACQLDEQLILYIVLGSVGGIFIVFVLIVLIALIILVIIMIVMKKTKKEVETKMEMDTIQKEEVDNEKKSKNDSEDNNTEDQKKKVEDNTNELQSVEENVKEG